MEGEGKIIANIQGEKCPLCKQNTLRLIEIERDIPLFGKALLMSMSCTNCYYHKADVELIDKKEPARYEVEIDSIEKLNYLVVRSSTCKVNLKNIASIEPGIGTNGFITTIEGLLLRFKRVVEQLLKDEDKETAKKAKSTLKKISRILGGMDKAKLIIEDPMGNSCIVGEDVIKKPIKTKLKP